MGNFSKHRNDRERYGKCSICMGNIPIEHYFAIEDEIYCHQCGTSYFLTSKNPVKLQMKEDRYGYDGYFEEELYTDY